MSRVEINAEGRQVVVDADVQLDEAADTAMKLWEHAESYRPLGPSTGFSSSERRWSPLVRPLCDIEATATTPATRAEGAPPNQ